jgi:hypothetical protein
MWGAATGGWCGGCGFGVLDRQDPLFLRERLMSILSAVV